jgi:hypothetical protein
MQVSFLTVAMRSDAAAQQAAGCAMARGLDDQPVAPYCRYCPRTSRRTKTASEPLRARVIWSVWPGNAESSMAGDGQRNPTT